MNTLFNLTKELVIYSSILIAGGIFLSKKLFGKKKVNKSFYDKNKKKIGLKSKLFFRDLTRKIDVLKKLNEDESDELTGTNLNSSRNSNTNKYVKMKKFVEKVTKEFDKSFTTGHKDEKGEKKIQITQPPSHKDQIFYYLLKNISTMMVKNAVQNEKEEVKNVEKNFNVNVSVQITNN